MGWQHDFCMDNAAFAGVVMGHSVPFVCYLVAVVDFIKEKWSFQFYVCSFNYYSSYFSFAVGVWIELFHLCGSLNNDGTCNRMHFD